MKHALVVGGTGMLRGVTLRLIEQGYHVSVIARNASRMKQLMEKASSQVTPLLVDYREDEELIMKVKESIKNNGKIDLVVAWIHSVASDALPIIMKEVLKGENETELFHILGSSSNLEVIKRKFPTPSNSRYYQIQLGFVMEETHSRWLTHKEICEGVIEAMKRKQEVYVVGQLEPCEERP